MVPPRIFIEVILQIETTAREIHALKSVIKIIENLKLESEYPRASLERRIEQLKREKRNMKHSAPASAVKPPQHQLQQQKQKRNIQKQKQQQSGIKRPRISTASVPSGYYDRTSTYGGINLQHHYQASYYPQ